MLGDPLVDALSDQLGRNRRSSVASHVDDTMKDCILQLYRSAAVGFGEWHDAVDAISRPGSRPLGGRRSVRHRRTSASGSPQRTGARLVMFPDSGHWWPVTKPAEVAAALEAHWA